MEHQTRVTNIKLRTKQEVEKKEKRESVQPVELPREENRWAVRFLHADLLVRNLAVVGVLLLTVIALRTSPSTQAQSVFSALQESAGMEWDESVGKLSFVNSLLPEALQEVWNPQPDFMVCAPLSGETLHVWTKQEPYITVLGRTDEIRAAADGEVMSIAHGLNEELIVRVRHLDDTEAVYGNLAVSHVDEGQQVYAGDMIGTLLSEQPLAFELRLNGRSVDPTGRMMPFDE